mmetsp:Transcript_38216/g.62020  ORF Transcript_38216/g.62020 Transcript_38216/m.62020 type:complete len:909 (+) Transcript_38216:214-2940(+)|eukprot:CAMPEP_0203757834 /NCGR_PEP_ID=MMETSP0098-20131031/10709_1 /ASSEMBLY_ACC=CAM_ASM_000208 /TAXON_ID=96639 /ORGANISM=" , Strain NY0313808BC1" /LENGTH=908 /DNA_ID=CAMNT_0050650073 /DNA_START=204 /DNA_END=2930 /DNA_ORIENTATION=+
MDEMIGKLVGMPRGDRGKSGVYVNFVNSVVASHALDTPLKRIITKIKTVGGVGMAALFAYYLAFLVKYRLQQVRSRLPLAPGPTPLPIIGSLHLVGSKIGPDGNPLVHLALMDIAKQYNGIFGLWLGAGYTIVISKPSVAEEAFCTHKLQSGFVPRGEMTTDRAANQSHGGHHVPSMYTMTRDGKGIAMSTGQYWKKVRGRLVAHITSKRVAEANQYMVKAEVESVCAEFRRKLARGEDINNLTAQLKRESMNMALRLLFSMRFGAQQPQEFLDLQYCVEYCFCNLAAGNPSDMIPFLRVLPNKFLREFEGVIELRDRVLGKMIRDHRNEWDKLRGQGKMKTRDNSRDILDQFFFDQVDGFEMKDENGVFKKTYLTEDEVLVCIWDIVFAMTDTTATTNEWLIYHMINEPEVQAKVHEELDRVVGPNRLPTLADKENLPYFWATIKEVMRYRIVSPVMAPHYAVEDITLHDTNSKEFFVPRGTAVFMHGYAMGLDAELWDEPEKFDPERWFTPRNQGLDLYGQVRRKNTEHYKFIPFSLGPRMCPGYAFANVAQFIQAATIMHCFRWKLSKDATKIAPTKISAGRLDLTENWGLTIMPQRYGEMGLITASSRPAADLCKPQEGDIEFTNTFLRRDTAQKVKLVYKEPLSHDTALFRFAFPDPTKVLGLPVGKHFKMTMRNVSGVELGSWNGRPDVEADANMIQRSYTPTSSDLDQGYVEVVVKCYRPKKLAKFPDGGKLTQQLDKLYIGDEVEIQGPYGRVEYLGRSKFNFGSRTLEKKMVGLIAGGTGITPMIQLLKSSLPDNTDDTMFSLIYANQTENDILLRDVLEDLANTYPERFKLHFTLDRPPETGWGYSKGFITAEMLRTIMPPVTDDTIILMCGPPPMIKYACRENLDKLGYPKDIQITF